MSLFRTLVFRPKFLPCQPQPMDSRPEAESIPGEEFTSLLASDPALLSKLPVRAVLRALPAAWRRQWKSRNSLLKRPTAEGNQKELGVLKWRTRNLRLRQRKMYAAAWIELAIYRWMPVQFYYSRQALFLHWEMEHLIHYLSTINSPKECAEPSYAPESRRTDYRENP